MPELSQGQPSNNNTVPDVDSQIQDASLEESCHSFQYSVHYSLALLILTLHM